MTQQFVDIKIVSLDEEASTPSGDGALVDIVLTLSHTAPAAWAQYFNQAWHQNFYMMKRRATVSGNRLHIICMPSEVQSEHLPELRKVIALTNDAYRDYASAQELQRQEAEQRARQQKEQITNLKANLKFD